MDYLLKSPKIERRDCHIKSQKIVCEKTDNRYVIMQHPRE